jgi:hypothetical protein
MEDGNYEFVITVGDWAGNVTQRKVVFAVDNTIARPGSREVVEGSQSTTATGTTSPRRVGNRPANY